MRGSNKFLCPQPPADIATHPVPVACICTGYFTASKVPTSILATTGRLLLHMLRTDSSRRITCPEIPGNSITHEAVTGILSSHEHPPDGARKDIVALPPGLRTTADFALPVAGGRESCNTGRLFPSCEMYFMMGLPEIEHVIWPV